MKRALIHTFGIKSRRNPCLEHVEVTVLDAMYGTVAAGTKHDEVGDLSHSSLFGLRQRDAMMGLGHLDAIDLERLDATSLAEEFTAISLGKGGLGIAG